MMKANTSDQDAVQRVRKFLRRLDDGEVSVDDAEQIREELREVVSRVKRVNKKFPGDQGPELSADVQHLFREIDRNKLRDRFSFLDNIAASFF
jgi:hypothetical protein